MGVDARAGCPRNRRRGRRRYTQDCDERIKNVALATVASDRSAGASPAVTGATRPRFSDITIRDRIMPNHVHAVAQVFPETTGSFWQKEY